jgi:predicted DNA-binding transcriptional regulator
MKSAYELAMERLAKSDPTARPKLNADQKTRLAEVDQVYKGKLAEREIFLRQQLDQAYAAQNAEEVQKINREIAGEKARLEEEREAEKDKIRAKPAK